MRFFVFVCLAVFMFAIPAIASDAPKGMTDFNIICPTQKLLPALDHNYHECHHGFINGSCEKFVKIFRQLTPEYDCQRPVDAMHNHNYTVPAIWLAGDAEMEDYTALLAQLSSGKGMYENKLFSSAVQDAQTLFSSQQFRDILSGTLAEEYQGKSNEMETGLKRKN